MYNEIARIASGGTAAPAHHRSTSRIPLDVPQPSDSSHVLASRLGKDMATACKTPVAASAAVLLLLIAAAVVAPA